MSASAHRQPAPPQRPSSPTSFRNRPEPTTRQSTHPPATTRLHAEPREPRRPPTFRGPRKTPPPHLIPQVPAQDPDLRPPRPPKFPSSPKADTPSSQRTKPPPDRRNPIPFPPTSELSDPQNPPFEHLHFQRGRIDSPVFPVQYPRPKRQPGTSSEAMRALTARQQTPPPLSKPYRAPPGILPLRAVVD